MTLGCRRRRRVPASPPRCVFRRLSCPVPSSIDDCRAERPQLDTHFVDSGKPMPRPRRGARGLQPGGSEHEQRHEGEVDEERSFDQSDGDQEGHEHINVETVLRVGVRRPRLVARRPCRHRCQLHRACRPSYTAGEQPSGGDNRLDDFGVCGHGFLLVSGLVEQFLNGGDHVCGAVFASEVSGELSCVVAELAVGDRGAEASASRSAVSARWGSSRRWRRARAGVAPRSVDRQRVRVARWLGCPRAGRRRWSRRRSDGQRRPSGNSQSWGASPIVRMSSPTTSRPAHPDCTTARTPASRAAWAMCRRVARRASVTTVLPRPMNTGGGPAARKSVSTCGGCHPGTGAGHQYPTTSRPVRQSDGRGRMVAEYPCRIGQFACVR